MGPPLYHVCCFFVLFKYVVKMGPPVFGAVLTDHSLGPLLMFSARTHIVGISNMRNQGAGRVNLDTLRLQFCQYCFDLAGPSQVKSQADKWLDHFNARHNPSGSFWVDSKKRPADFAAEGDEAVTLPKLSPEDPETIEELEKGAAGQGLKKGLSTLQTGLLVAKTTEGAVYLYAEDADMVARKDIPLYGWGPGKWLVDKELKAAEEKTASAPTLVPFMCNDTQEEIRFYGKPPFTDAASSSSPQPLRQFLQYLEKTHNVTEHTLVNHTVERTDGGANSNPDYIVKQVLPCKFLPSSKDDKNWCVAVTYAKIAASERVRVMVDIECQVDQKIPEGLFVIIGPARSFT